MFNFTAECTAVDLRSPDVIHSMLVVAAAPFIWNVLARLIHRYLPASTSMGTRYTVCYTLFLWIFTFSTYRNYLFHAVIDAHPRCEAPEAWRMAWFGVAWAAMLMATYTHYVLGPTGVSFGDACGIFMDERVTDFPYTWFDDPMYTFTSIYFIASAVADLSATGLIIALEVAFVYWITCKVEGPYTAAIYEQRAREKAAQIKPASEDEVATAKKPEAPSDDANIKQRKTNSSTSN